MWAGFGLHSESLCGRRSGTLVELHRVDSLRFQNRSHPAPVARSAQAPLGRRLRAARARRTDRTPFVRCRSGVSRAPLGRAAHAPHGARRREWGRTGRTRPWPSVQYPPPTHRGAGVLGGRRGPRGQDDPPDGGGDTSCDRRCRRVARGRPDPCRCLSLAATWPDRPTQTDSTSALDAPRA